MLKLPFFFVIKRKIKILLPHVERASWAIAEQIFGPLIMLALTPFLLEQLGIEQYGLWALVLAVAGMGQFISLGAGAATIKHVSADMGEGKNVDAVYVIRAAITVVIVVGSAASLLLAILAPFIAEMFFAKMGEAVEVARILVLALVLMFVQEMDNVFASAMRGAQRFDLSAKLEFITRLMWAISVAILAWYFKNLPDLIGGVILLSLIKVGIKAHLVNRIFSVSNCYKPLFQKKYLKRVANFGKWTWLQGIGGILFSVADRVLIGSIFGAADLGRYSICMQVAQYAHSIPAAGLQIIFPWISQKIGKSGVAIKTLNLYKYALYGGALCLLLPITLLIFLPFLITIWLGNSFYLENRMLFMVLIFSYGLMGFNVAAHFFLMGLGEIKFVSLSNLIAGIVTVLGAVILSPFGLIWFSASKLLFGPVILVNFLKLRKLS